jgi:septal ring factor EnvC (AmiA/AmiB activator)
VTLNSNLRVVSEQNKYLESENARLTENLRGLHDRLAQAKEKRSKNKKDIKTLRDERAALEGRGL